MATQMKFRQWQSESNFGMWCFFSTKITYNHFIVQFVFLVSNCYRFVEPKYKNIRFIIYLDYDMFCTNEGTR